MRLPPAPLSPAGMPGIAPLCVRPVPCPHPSGCHRPGRPPGLMPTFPRPRPPPSPGSSPRGHKAEAPFCRGCCRPLFSLLLPARRKRRRLLAATGGWAPLACVPECVPKRRRRRRRLKLARSAAKDFLSDPLPSVQGRGAALYAPFLCSSSASAPRSSFLSALAPP